MNNERRINVLKRVLKDLAHLPQTPTSVADRNELELMIVELGGDARTAVHRTILKSRERKDG